ncbi:MAG: PAS domain-containing protein [Burkholderiales bacterium]|nr:PAS domain-containing protein [Burkholderiales bacterium]
MDSVSQAGPAGALQASRAAEHEYAVLLNESSDPIFAFYPDGTYRYVNRAFAAGVGRQVEEIIGRTIWDLFPPEDANRRFAAVKEVFASARVKVIEVAIARPDGDHYYVTTVKPVIGEDGQVLSVICISKDITERKRMEVSLHDMNQSLEQRVAQRTAALEAANVLLLQSEQALKTALREKEALLKEVHHRVKNNLQVITSLLRLESRRSTQADTSAVLRDMKGRIRSMALLHETLYRSGTFAAVDLAEHLRHIASHAMQAQSSHPQLIALEFATAPLRVGMDQAMPCGLLVNELISNCLKHAFPPGRAGRVCVALQPMGDGVQWSLRVSDTGVGLPADFADRSQTSLGLQLVGDLAGQMGGRIAAEAPVDQGAAFYVVFTPLQQSATPASA